jgi:hypothetical protein
MLDSSPNLTTALKDLKAPAVPAVVRLMKSDEICSLQSLHGQADSPLVLACQAATGRARMSQCSFHSDEVMRDMTKISNLYGFLWYIPNIQK